MGILRDLSKAIKGLFYNEREGDVCPRRRKEELIIKRERVYGRLIEREGGSYAQPSPFEPTDSPDMIYETRDQIFCSHCGYRGRAIIAHDDGESER